MEVSASLVIKVCEPRPTIGPSTRAGVHSKGKILLLFKEIDPVSSIERIHPPFQICLDSSIDEEVLWGRDEASRLAARSLVVRILPDLTTEAAWSNRPHKEANSFSVTMDLDNQLVSDSSCFLRFFSGKEIVFSSKSNMKPSAVLFEVGATT